MAQDQSNLEQQAINDLLNIDPNYEDLDNYDAYINT